MTAFASRERPLPAHWTVREGRDAYLAENGFRLADYDAEYSEYPLLGLKLPVPNPSRRRRAVRLHDLHHVATGYGTDKAGEGEISAWEMRRGVGALGWYVAAIGVGGFLIGLVLAPLRTLRGWRAGANGDANLFHDSGAYEALLELSIGELRRRLGVPEEGLHQGPRALHAAAPAS
jgi:hypothetical protein